MGCSAEAKDLKEKDTNVWLSCFTTVFIATVDDDAEAVGNLSVVTPKAASWTFVAVIKFVWKHVSMGN